MSIGGWVHVKNFHENQKYIGTFGPPFSLFFAKDLEIVIFVTFLDFQKKFLNFLQFFRKYFIG